MHNHGHGHGHDQQREVRRDTECCSANINGRSVHADPLGNPYIPVLVEGLATKDDGEEDGDVVPSHEEEDEAHVPLPQTLR